MRPKTFMFIAGEASGDVLAAELVKALRTALPSLEAAASSDPQPLRASLEPRFLGAGGPRMLEAGVDLALDLTAHSVIGLSDVLKNILKFKRIFNHLVQVAIERQPDAIICVDYAGFNLRFAAAIKRYVRSLRGTFGNWDPLLVQYVSPQIWASRAGRARTLEKCSDLLLSIFPFEKEWYARHTPKLRVEFVGHPMVDRYKDWPHPRSPLPMNPVGTRSTASHYSSSGSGGQSAKSFGGNLSPSDGVKGAPNPLLVLLPGSRPAEVQRHLPVLAAAWQQMATKLPLRNAVILPNETLLQTAQLFLKTFPGLNLQVGGLAKTLQESGLAMAASGTVTMECAWFGVPTVTLYKSSWSNYRIAKGLIQVPFLAMPNLLAQERVYPEFIQEAATPENLAGAGLELLSDPKRRLEIQAKLDRIIDMLGPPGAAQRAAQYIVELLRQRGPAQIKGGLQPAA